MFIQVKIKQDGQSILINCAYIKEIRASNSSSKLSIIELVENYYEQPSSDTTYVVDEPISSLTHRLTMQRAVII